MGVPSIENPDWDQLREHPGFEARRSRIGRQAGAHKLGASLWEMAPGQASYPYHWHFAEEELVIVLSGTPQLRTPDGVRRLEQGEVVSFPTGEAGAHQLINDRDEPVRFLSFSNTQQEVCVYPDSGKVGVFEDVNGQDGIRHIFRVADEVDYYEGESH